MGYRVDGQASACGPGCPWGVIDEADSSIVACYPSEATATEAVAELAGAAAEGDGAGGGGSVGDGPGPLPPSSGGYVTQPRTGTYATTATFAPAVPAPTGQPVSGAPMPMPDMPMPPGEMPVMPGCVAWSGTIAMENTSTGDHRQFTPGALTWADLPMPLRWLAEDTHGGVLVNGVVNVGRIDSITRAGSEIRATGILDCNSAEGAECARRMGTADNPGFLSGISIDADDPTNGLVEYVMAPGCDNPTSLDQAMACAEPELTIYHAGRIRAATLCDIPAFVQARIYLDAPLPATVSAAGRAPMAAAARRPAGGTGGGANPTGGGCCDTCEQTDALAAILAAAHAIHLTVPDGTWFTEPAGPPEIGAITVTDNGRLFGLLAPRHVAHRGYPDRFVSVPLGVDYSRWMNRATVVAGGARIATGAITMGCGHAPTHNSVSAAAAAEHYDNTCAVVATARVGENRHGVWIAGALLPDVTPDQVARLLACQLSGDWRANRDRPGTRELVGVLAVPVPGFPVAHRDNSPRLSTMDGQLVASAVPIRHASTASGVFGGGAFAAQAFAVSGDTHLPVADPATGWDGGAAAGRVFDAHTNADGTLDPGAVGRAFFWHDGDGTKRGDWKLGFADVVGGTLTMIPRGVSACTGAHGLPAVQGLSPAEHAATGARICSAYGAIQAKYPDWPDCPLGAGANGGSANGAGTNGAGAGTAANGGVTIAARILAASIRRDRASRLAALARLVRGI